MEGISKIEYKFNHIDQNILPLPVITDKKCGINITKTVIKTTKDSVPVIKGYRVKASYMWYIKLDVIKQDIYALFLSIIKKDGLDNNINMLLPEGNIR